MLGLETSEGQSVKYLHTMVRVSDLDESLDFYCRKLDFVIDYTRGVPPIMAVISQGEWSDDQSQLRCHS